MKLKKLKHVHILVGFAVGVVIWNILKLLWKAEWDLVGLWFYYHGNTLLLVLSLLFLFGYGVYRFIMFVDSGESFYRYKHTPSAPGAKPTPTGPKSPPRSLNFP